MHKPVLLNETIKILDPKPGEFFIDGTIGSGGHAVKIFEKIMPNGKLLGIDLDENNLKIVREKILAGTSNQELVNRNKLILEQGNYADLPEILKKHNLPKASGLILDLGFSSEQLELGKGFSFQKNELLDMRYNTSQTNTDYTRINTDGQYKSALSQYKSELTAMEVINTFNEKDLADIIYKYGEERYSRRIAKKIIEQRKRKLIKTTFDLVEVIKKSVPRNYERGRISPATRTFQALRIYVNHELENLEKLLKNIDQIIKGRIRLRASFAEVAAKAEQGFGGRVVIISFHSLEDRIVKNYFRELKKDKKAEILTKKPIRATNEEIKSNHRARSAKLRGVVLK
ncbi:MAG TPA: 16S rRNA (cytosine(1402)-N(4))-methyltransferase [Candidatus Wolfebacteria bacterium]|nr:16S rRNA (cytosine(1402)-N(4))-methyltransferase [Candidatus Wolfebacteria bacterium]